MSPETNPATKHDTNRETDVDDSPYDLLAEDLDTGHRWAFGTGFLDPLEGIDTAVPDGLDAQRLAAYCLALGDDALILSHRLQEWITRLPELEEETAIANIALDLLGQARMLLARAGGIVGRSEDDLAFLRLDHEFVNVGLVEREATDFAELVGGLLVFSVWRLALLEALSDAPDPVLAAIAAKGAKELRYHRDYAAQWVVRLGDGTPFSHERMQAALHEIWPLIDELFRPDTNADAYAATVDRARIDAELDTVLATAGLERPNASPRAGVAGRFGRDGVHTEAFGRLVAELQSTARAYPDATW